MEYDSATEKAAIISTKKVQSSIDDLLRIHPGIKSTQNKILRLLSIELVIMTIYLTLQTISIVSDYTKSSKIDKGTLIELFITVILIFYLIAFITVAIGYFPVAIFLFNCLTAIQLAYGLFLFIFAIMAMVSNLSLATSVGMDIILDAVHIMVAVSVIILSILIIISSLNLMTLIKI